MEEATAAPAKSLTDLKQSRELAMPNQKIDMFSSHGFELAQRIGKAYATSDAVPAAFRAFNLKKDKNGEQWVENTSALGNCLVAIETAQAVGMSITAVMQNSNIIEGKLSWSGQFKIGAVNASRRFTPLRFDIKTPGKIKATYKEKDGWNNEKKKYNMIEHTIELDNIVCIAWALPYGMQFPAGVNTLDQARAAGLPVIEGPPISMKLAVEEGWYAKPGSKWQTEMKHKMLPIRAGAYFSDIHASDIVMGMGRTSDELEDMSNTIDVEQQSDGRYAANLDELRAAKAPAKEAKHANAETVEVRDNHPDPAEQPAAEAEPAKTAAPEPITQEASNAYEKLMGQINAAKNIDALAEACDLVKTVDNQALHDALMLLYKRRYAELETMPEADPEPQDAKPKPRARRAPGTPAAD